MSIHVRVGPQLYIIHLMYTLYYVFMYTLYYGNNKSNIWAEQTNDSCCFELLITIFSAQYYYVNSKYLPHVECRIFLLPYLYCTEDLSWSRVNLKFQTTGQNDLSIPSIVDSHNICFFFFFFFFLLLFLLSLFFFFFFFFFFCFFFVLFLH